MGGCLNVIPWGNPIHIPFHHGNLHRAAQKLTHFHCGFIPIRTYRDTLNACMCVECMTNLIDRGPITITRGQPQP